MKTCDCNNLTLGNSGRTDCDVIASVMQGGFFMFTTADDGTKNKIVLSADIDDAFITARINDTDASKRWYPTGELENIQGERAEAVFATAPSGRKVRLKDGVRNVIAEMWEQGPSLMQEWEKASCPQISYFAIDDEGKLTGMVLDPEDANLYPIKIQKNTFSMNLKLATEDLPSMVELSFDFDSNEEDSLLKSIAKADISADLLVVNGLFGVTSTYAGIATTKFTVTLTEKYGSAKNKILVGGLLTGDMALYNVTDSAAVPITVFTEVTKGVYKLEYAAETSGDVLRLTITKEGFEFSSVTTNTILIP